MKSLALWVMVAGCAGEKVATETGEPAGEEVATPEPTIEVEPMEVDFGEIDSSDGVVSVTKAITVSNTGDGDLEIIEVRNTEPSGDITLTLAGGQSIAAGASEAVEVVLNGAHGGAVDETFFIVSNDAVNPEVALEFSGLVFAPNLEPDPMRMNFGGVTVGTTANVTLLVDSTGNVALDLAEISFSGGDYTLANGTVPVSIAPGEKNGFLIAFSPVAEGEQQETMTLHSNDPAMPEWVVELSGTGLL